MDEAELSDEQLRKLLKPNPSDEQVIAMVKDNFADSPNDTIEILKDLESYDDRNYWMKIGGVDYLVKVHNGVESLDLCKAIDRNALDSVIHFQYEIMRTLAENGICASRPIPPRQAETSKSVIPLIKELPVVSEDRSPCRLAVSVYTWVPGKTMAALNMLPIECLAGAGRFLGDLHHKLDLLSPEKLPAAKRYHQWDGKNTSDLKDYLYCIEDEGRRSMITNIIEAFHTNLIAPGVADSFRNSVNHGDFNDANILLDGDFNVSGVIDFGDSVHSWTVLDISVAMAYAMLSAYGKPGRSLSAAAAMLRGFHSVYPLTDTEREHLVLLVACRLACSVTLGAYSYKQNPENKYLLLHAEPAWQALELIWGNDLAERKRIGEATNYLFEVACNFTDLPDSGAIDCTDLSIPDRFVLGWFSSLKGRENLIMNTAKRQKRTKQAQITFVTGNKKKLEEVKRILLDDTSQSLGILLTNVKIDLPELQGDPVTIAKKKCEAAAKEIDGAVITEDTSLCFTALKGLPGPYIKWFLDECGHDGLNKIIEAYDDKSAYAQTIVAFCAGPGKEVVVFVGKTMGNIVHPRGKLDFGWDPVFEPSEMRGKTYAEMTKEEKDSISHRSRAFLKLREYLIREKATVLASIASS